MITVLVMGLPDSGKSTFAARLRDYLEPHFESPVAWHNADALRTAHNDWDFSPEGRLRQAHRMKGAAAKEHSTKTAVCILDFVCPTPQYREIVDPDIIVFLSTRDASMYENTNSVFQSVSLDEAEALHASLYHITSFEEEDAVLVRVVRECTQGQPCRPLVRPGLFRRLALALRSAL